MERKLRNRGITVHDVPTVRGRVVEGWREPVRPGFYATEAAVYDVRRDGSVWATMPGSKPRRVPFVPLAAERMVELDVEADGAPRSVSMVDARAVAA